MNLDANYWNQRYKENNTPWDAGSITTPIKEYIDQLEDRTLNILIPGAGAAHEAAYLHKKGFKKVWVCDWATDALSKVQEQIPNFPKTNLLACDFFDLEQQFDLIIEQTFFCALPKSLRAQYAEKTAQLLQAKGKLVGLLFNREFDFQGPPFGGSLSEYKTYFSPHFDIYKMESCNNSIKARKGKELFINLRKL